MALPLDPLSCSSPPPLCASTGQCPSLMHAALLSLPSISQHQLPHTCLMSSLCPHVCTSSSEFKGWVSCVPWASLVCLLCAALLWTPLQACPLLHLHHLLSLHPAPCRS